MFEASDLAVTNLKAYLEQNNVDQAIRIAAMHSCSGAALGLALDEEKETDNTYKIDSLTFLVDKELSETCGKIALDYVENGASTGFSVTPEKPLPQPEGGGCSSGSCSSGSCCG